MQSETKKAERAAAFARLWGPKAEQPALEAENAAAEDGPIGLLDYATDEERDELVGLKDARDKAEAEQRRMTLKASELERQAALASQAEERGRAARRAALAAVALGEVDAGAVPEAPKAAAGESPDEMRDAAKVLTVRAEEKREEATEHHGALRARVIDLFKTCANRAAADYLERARRLAEIHAAIGGVQELLNGLGNARAGRTPEVLVDLTWHELGIPSSEALPALRGRGYDSWFKRWLAGGDASHCHKAAAAAYAAAQAEIRDLVGEWPLTSRRG